MKIKRSGPAHLFERSIFHTSLQINYYVYNGRNDFFDWPNLPYPPNLPYMGIYKINYQTESSFVI